MDMDEPTHSTHRDFPRIRFRTRVARRRGGHWIAEAWCGENVVASEVGGTEARAMSKLRQSLMGTPYHSPAFPDIAPGLAPHSAA